MVKKIFIFIGCFFRMNQWTVLVLSLFLLVKGIFLLHSMPTWRHWHSWFSANHRFCCVFMIFYIRPWFNICVWLHFCQSQLKNYFILIRCLMIRCQNHITLNYIHVATHRSLIGFCTNLIDFKTFSATWFHLKATMKKSVKISIFWQDLKKLHKSVNFFTFLYCQNNYYLRRIIINLYISFYRVDLVSKYFRGNSWALNDLAEKTVLGSYLFLINFS